MSLFLAWLCFPLIMAAVGGGWGLLVEGAVGRPLPKALIIPTGLAALLVVDGTLTAFGPTAPASPYVAALGAALGLGLYLWPRPRLTRDLGVRLLAGRPRLPLPDGFAGAAAVLVILLYGLPILLYGHATFAGYLRLDDTATWLNVADIIVHHGRDWQALPTSTFRLVFSGDVGESYPLGSFVLLGIGHELSGINSAWIFDPFLAICAGPAPCLPRSPASPPSSTATTSGAASRNLSPPSPLPLASPGLPGPPAPGQGTSRPVSCCRLAWRPAP